MANPSSGLTSWFFNNDAVVAVDHTASSLRGPVSLRHSHRVVHMACHGWPTGEVVAGGLPGNPVAGCRCWGLRGQKNSPQAVPGRLMGPVGADYHSPRRVPVGAVQMAHHHLSVQCPSRPWYRTRSQSHQASASHTVKHVSPYFSGIMRSDKPRAPESNEPAGWPATSRLAQPQSLTTRGQPTPLAMWMNPPLTRGTINQVTDLGIFIQIGEEIACPLIIPHL